MRLLEVSTVNRPQPTFRDPFDAGHSLPPSRRDVEPPGIDDDRRPFERDVGIELRFLFGWAWIPESQRQTNVVGMVCYMGFAGRRAARLMTEETPQLQKYVGRIANPSLKPVPTVKTLFVVRSNDS